MNIYSFGNLGQYVQQKNLKLNADYKIKTGSSLDEMKEELKKSLESISDSQKTQSTNLTKATRSNIIRQKLR